MCMHMYIDIEQKAGKRSTAAELPRTHFTPLELSFQVVQLRISTDIMVYPRNVLSYLGGRRLRPRVAPSVCLSVCLSNLEPRAWGGAFWLLGTCTSRPDRPDHGNTATSGHRGQISLVSDEEPLR